MEDSVINRLVASTVSQFISNEPLNSPYFYNMFLNSIVEFLYDVRQI